MEFKKKEEVIYQFMKLNFYTLSCEGVNIKDSNTRNENVFVCSRIFLLPKYKTQRKRERETLLTVVYTSNKGKMERYAIH